VAQTPPTSVRQLQLDRTPGKVTSPRAPDAGPRAADTRHCPVLTRWRARPRPVGRYGASPYGPLRWPSRARPPRLGPPPPGRPALPAG
jgi:hypothetical protein